MILLLFILPFFHFVRDLEGKNVRSSEITLITGFFDDYSTVSRSPDLYFEYFKSAARLENDLVVFCQNNLVKNRVLSIRKDFGLENKTSVIIIDDIRSINSSMFEKMVQISTNPGFLYITKGTVPDYLNPNFVYLQSLKPYFLHRASSELNIKTANVAWIDFGFNNPMGRDAPVYDENDFSRKLECEVSEKVSVFNVMKKESLGKKIMFDILRNANFEVGDSSFIICPTNLTNTYLEVFQECLDFFLELGLFFDDQAVGFYLSEKRRDIFEAKQISESKEMLFKFCNMEKAARKKNTKKSEL